MLNLTPFSGVKKSMCLCEKLLLLCIMSDMHIYIDVHFDIMLLCDELIAVWLSIYIISILYTFKCEFVKLRYNYAIDGNYLSRIWA